MCGSSANRFNGAATFQPRNVRPRNPNQSKVFGRGLRGAGLGTSGPRPTIMGMLPQDEA